MLLPSKGDVTIGGGTEESGVHLKKIKRSSLKRKGQAIKVIRLRIYQNSQVSFKIQRFTLTYRKFI